MFARKCAFALIISVFAAGAPAADRDSGPDLRVKRIVDERGLKYIVDDDDDFRIVYEYDDGRTQVGFIRSATETFRDVEVREIWSYAYESDGDELPAEVANRLLTDTFENKMGAWARDKRFALYVTQVPADADTGTLMAAVDFTLQVADDMEKEFTGDDDTF